MSDNTSNWCTSSNRLRFGSCWMVNRFEKSVTVVPLLLMVISLLSLLTCCTFGIIWFLALSGKNPRQRDGTRQVLPYVDENTDSAKTEQPRMVKLSGKTAKIRMKFPFYSYIGRWNILLQVHLNAELNSIVEVYGWFYLSASCYFSCRILFHVFSSFDRNVCHFRSASQARTKRPPNLNMMLGKFTSCSMPGVKVCHSQVYLSHNHSLSANWYIYFVMQI